jgi:hypothetical protein
VLGVSSKHGVSANADIISYPLTICALAGLSINQYIHIEEQGFLWYTFNYENNIGHTGFDVSAH